MNNTMENRLIRGRNFKKLKAPRLTRRGITMIKHLKDNEGEWFGSRGLGDAGLSFTEKMEQWKCLDNLL